MAALGGGGASALEQMQRQQQQQQDTGEDYYEEEEEEMPATERELADDAEWKLIQKNTFARWANEHLKTVNKNLSDLEHDFSDGLRLIALIEVLSGEKIRKYNKRPSFRTQKLENVTVVLRFLEHDEGVRLVNIDSSHIVDNNLKLILGLIWTLILHYSISMPQWEDEDFDDDSATKKDQTPKQRLLNWVQGKVPDKPIKNFTTDWNDGTLIGALVDSIAPGLCPDWEDLDPKKGKQNAAEGIEAADKWLNVPQLIKPEEMANPKIDEHSMMTYLSQFPNAKLKDGAPLRPRTNPKRVRAYGPGIDATGNCVNAPARFTVETFSAGRGDIEVIVLNPQDQQEKCSITLDNKRNQTYSCVYTPTVKGSYKVIVRFAGQEIPKSPYTVGVDEARGDSNLCKAFGPGVEMAGVQVNKKTYFEVSAIDAGVGVVDVAVLDPRGHKDAVRPVISKKTPELWYVEYTAEQIGIHSVNVFFAGKPVPNSPFGVAVSPAGQIAEIANIPSPQECTPVEAARASYSTPTNYKPTNGKQPTSRKQQPGEAPIKPQKSGPGNKNVPNNQRAQPTFGRVPMKRQTVDANKVYATGRGIQPKGIRINEDAEFHVHTEKAGEGELVVKVIAPNGSEENLRMKRITDNEAAIIYKPITVGMYKVEVTYGGQTIARAPFNVQVGAKAKGSKIIAYGPGLEGGVVDMPALFTVETNGETGALGFSIEGPSEASIDCKDNGDGSANVSYMPKAAGEYAVHILCDDEDINKSPFMADIKPNNGEFDVAKVTASGPGLEPTGVTVMKWADFTVDTQQASKPRSKIPLHISALDKDMDQVEVIVKDNKDGTFACRYMPKKNVKHTIIIAYGGVAIPNSPFKVDVSEASNPRKVKVSGPAVENKAVKTFEPTYLVVDCSEAGPGDVAISLTDEQGLDVQVENTVQSTGVYKVDFQPEKVGKYDARVFFAGQEIPMSPYKINVIPSIDVSKVKIEGLQEKVEVGKQVEFEILTNGAGNGKVQVMVVSPSGQNMPALVQTATRGFKSKFTTNEPGEHSVHVTFAGQSVPKSPVKITSVAPVKPIAKQPSAAGKVKAYGDGLQGGVANSPAEFTIDTRDVGPTKAGLGLTIEGASEAKIECVDGGDGTCKVRYWPTEPGSYTIKITFGDELIPGAPFKAQVKPSRMVDVSSVKAYGPGLEATGVFLESTTYFTVDATKVPVKEGSSPGVVKAFVTIPDGQRMEAIVTDKHDGTYKCEYAPFQKGSHKIDVTYEGLQIPESPFTIEAGPGHDSSRVKAYGPGLQGGLTEQPATFVVETNGAGQGGLGLAIEGPCKAETSVVDNKDGSCSVEYLPTKPGKYDIAIKFADEHIPGSPFKAEVVEEIHPEVVRCFGPGVESSGVRATIPTRFTVDTTAAGQAVLAVSVTDSSGKPQQALIEEISEDAYNVSYTPTKEGPCCVDVTYDGVAVPDSPFKTKVEPRFDANLVKVTGEGVRQEGVLASLPVAFTVDARDAGLADLEVAIQNSSSKPVSTKLKDNGDGTYVVEYVPEEVGEYTTKVHFGGDEVMNSPFKVNVASTGDASKVKIVEGLRTTIAVGEECVINIDATEAGIGQISCSIAGDGGEVDISVVDNGDGTISIIYTPQRAGQYSVDIKFGGMTIPNGQFDQKALPQDEIDNTKVCEEGLIRPDHVSTNASAVPNDFMPVDFCIPIGPIFNFVSAKVTTPSGKIDFPTVDDNKDGTVTIRYEPGEVGQHLLDVNYNDAPINGSPFKFHVDAIDSGYVTAHGPGLSHGVSGSFAHFTIVTKHAGAGGLGIAIEGPSNADMNCVDNKDGTCSVQYLPTSAGQYTINIKFADKDISGSPFNSNIISSSGDDRQRAKITIGSNFDVAIKVDDDIDIDTLMATITYPSGEIDQATLKLLPNNNLGISFTEKMVGEHLVHVYRRGVPIANSPFKVVVGEKEKGNAKLVKATGKGLVEGHTNEVNTFTVDTKNAGYGGLSLSIEGPSKVDLECQDNSDGTCLVTYVPSEPGDYVVNIKFADEHLPGSPYIVKIAGEPSGKMTGEYTSQRHATDTTHIGSECELSLKIPGTSMNELKAYVTSPNGVTEMAKIMRIEEGHYSIKFVPREIGVHTISVKRNDTHIHGSPFQFTVGAINSGGAHKVRAIGPGLHRAEVNSSAHFNVYTREAGAGGLTIAIEGPSKAEINFQDRDDGSSGVSYTCTAPGDYLASIKFNDQHIPDSPFKVQVSPKDGDIHKLNVEQIQENLLQVNRPASFNVDLNGAHGKLNAKVQCPSGDIEEAIITEVGQDKYTVRFIPKENGVHMIFVRLNGEYVPGSPYRVFVGQQKADPAMVNAYGDGLVTGQTGVEGKFIVNTSKAGSGALGVTVDGPSKVSLHCHEVTDVGYEFGYTPTASGEYLIAIKYAGAHVPGSPFAANIDGDGNVHQGAWMERSSQRVIVIDDSEILASGEGLKSATCCQTSSYEVNASNSSMNMLLVGIIGPSIPEFVTVNHKGNSKFTVNYKINETGKYMMAVKYGEDHVKGSPFEVNVK